MTASPDGYGAQYYEENGQDSDRVALWFYARVVRRLVSAGSSVLDYGCGSGFFVRRLGQHFKTSGFDVSPYAREQTKANAGAVTVYGAPDEVPPSQAFDLVTALHVLEHIPDPSAPLESFRQWLRPGGKLAGARDSRGRSGSPTAIPRTALCFHRRTGWPASERRASRSG
jgi:2-polyprenyl-3-methyl-5-hydroxy-6-metoxy-1,4-benzoquinol methylase